jgi:hypothetical protein
MNLVRVEGESHLYRDETSMAIINKDKSAYNAYIESRNRKLQEKNEIEDLKKDVSELKELVYKLIEKL